MRTLNVGIITCWYKNMSMANYSYDLIKSLENYPFIKIKVISSRCFCEREKFSGLKEIFQSEKCHLINFPPFVHLHPKKKFSWILYMSLQVVLHFLRGIAYLSNCKSCDIIHYQLSAHSLGILPLIPLMLIPTPNKRIVTSHTIDRTAGLRFLKRIYNRANKIIVHSRDMKESLVSLGVNPSKIEVIPHGVRIPKLHFRQRDKITFFGAPIEEKGAFVLFEALKILKEKGENIKVHFYGIYSASEKEAAREQAKKLGVEECIIWGGRLSEHDFDAKMQESMFTFTVYTKPVSGSNVLTRAMANATPVIVSNIGGLPEYSQKFGTIIPPNNPEALANAILMLNKDQNLRTKLGEIARAEALKISWDAIAKRTLEVYLNALEH